MASQHPARRPAREVGRQRRDEGETVRADQATRGPAARPVRSNAPAEPLSRPRQGRTRTARSDHADACSLRYRRQRAHCSDFGGDMIASRRSVASTVASVAEVPGQPRVLRGIGREARWFVVQGTIPPYVPQRVAGLRFNTRRSGTNQARLLPRPLPASPPRPRTALGHGTGDAVAQGACPAGLRHRPQRTGDGADLGQERQCSTLSSSIIRAMPRTCPDATQIAGGLSFAVCSRVLLLAISRYSPTRKQAHKFIISCTPSGYRT